MTDAASTKDSLQADKGDEYDRADLLKRMGLEIDGHNMGELLRQAMHDRDRFQRERDYFEELFAEAQELAIKAQGALIERNHADYMRARAST